tara:strand:- start:297 stop:1460 length:1164 start_codon:yes stop_codon:yes gene_type:complete
MATTLQLRRGTTTQHNSFTGAVGEVTVDTTKDVVVVHDGSTAGGIPMAKTSGAVFTGSVTPTTADGAALGSATLEFSDLFLADSSTIQFGNDQDITLTHAADTSLTLGGAGSTTGLIVNNTATDGDPFLAFALSGTATFTMGVDDGDSDKFKIGTTAIGTNTRFSIDSSGNVSIPATTANTVTTDGALIVSGGVGIALDLTVGDDVRLKSDSAVLSFGSDDEITLTHAADDGLTLNGTFTTANSLLINGTTPTLTIGDAGAEDTKIVFDGNAQDFYIALDDSADDLLIGKGSAVGTTPAIAIDENLKFSLFAKPELFGDFLLLNGTDGSSTDAGDNIILDRTDAGGSDAGDDVILEFFTEATNSTLKILDSNGTVVRTINGVGGDGL